MSGRASAALRDVVVNARARWPAVAFEIREVAVQGQQAVAQVVDAIGELNAVAEVDVIVIARGGGSVEDLLPFSNERLVRAIAASRAPIVSAIGHEQDVPLADLVADLRASTPTDAAKRIVPDADEELAFVLAARTRLHGGIGRRIDAEQERLDRARTSSSRAVRHRLERASADNAHLLARLRALSPQATLERGYAVVRRADDGAIVRDPGDAETGVDLDIRVAHGSLRARRT